MTALRRDDGSVLVLLIGLVTVVLLLVAVVTDVSSLFLARRGLAVAADGAALAGAQAIDAEAFYTGRAEPGTLPLDPQASRASVDRYLRAAATTDRYPGLAAATTTSATGEVTVRLSAPVTLPFRRFLSGAPGVVITATATAASPLR